MLTLYSKLNHSKDFKSYCYRSVVIFWDLVIQIGLQYRDIMTTSHQNVSVESSDHVRQANVGNGHTTPTAR